MNGRLISRHRLPDTKMWVIVPVKELAHSKSRLAAVLPAEDRAELTRQLLRRTLRVLGQAPGAAGVIVVSRDTAVAQIAATYGAIPLAEKVGAGLNGAIRLGLQKAAAMGTSQVLILPSDLPFLRVEDVAVMGDPSSPAILIANDRNGTGTNALRLPLPTEFWVQYGRNSYHKHLAEARRLNLTIHTITSATLQFDLDTPQDWREFVTQEVQLL